MLDVLNIHGNEDVRLGSKLGRSAADVVEVMPHLAHGLHSDIVDDLRLEVL